MKYYKLFIPFFIGAFILYTDAIAQVQIEYENPPIYARERSGQMPTYRGDLKDSGYLIVDAEEKSLTMISDSREQRKFTFFDINQEPVSGHYLGFGDNIMFNFIPEDRLLILMYRRNHIYNFLLDRSDVEKLLNEMNSN